MISGEGTIHTAVEATKKGAYDFLEKPVDTDRLLLTVKNALDRGRLEMEKEQLLDRVKQHYVMIGTSSKMKEIHELIQKAGATNSKVLVEGENGTGKELVARAIHHESSRAGQSFVAVNCAAIPETLIESELFGHKKGSFTGAIADKPGRFQTADGGTLFLDEIGDMSLMTQAKVLRALEEGVVEMVGSGESISVDVRVIAATNKDLQKEMQNGNFREDLFFRLNVLNIKVPPLRERKEDIPLLVDYYIQYFCAEHGIKLKKMTSKAMQHLLRHNWPGNVRELKNFIEKLVILISPAEILSEHITSILEHHTLSKPAVAEDLSLKEARESFERDYIRQKLTMCDWNVTKAAQILGVPRTYLYKKMHMLGIEI
jgi:two-component system nitrogen regulation response regulator NtrX